MIGKLAIKRLTESDLTFFNYHFQRGQAGNQKAINLNADVFVKQFYPGINDSDDWNIPVDLWIAGPNAADPFGVARKIIKGSSYKNWRLDGEVVHNPLGMPERFDSLRAGDIALVRFEGGLSPRKVFLLLVGRSLEHDAGLFEKLNEVLDRHRMKALEIDVLRDLCEDSSVPETHPIWEAVSDEDLIEAAMGQAPATNRLLVTRRHMVLSLSDLHSWKQAAERVGRLGEVLVNGYLEGQKTAGKIEEYEWTSNINAISPFDFRLRKGGAWEKLEVKATPYSFKRDYHLPQSELYEMADYNGIYRIGRVYRVSENGAKMRLSVPLREFGRSILDVFCGLPEGITPDSVSVTPDESMFAEEIELSALTDNEW